MTRAPKPRWLLFRGMASFQCGRFDDATTDYRTAWESATGEDAGDPAERAIWRMVPSTGSPAASWWSEEPSRVALLLLLEIEMAQMRMAAAQPDKELVVLHLKRANDLAVTGYFLPWLDRSAIQGRIEAQRLLVTDDVNARSQIFVGLINLLGVKNAKEHVDAQFRLMQESSIIGAQSKEWIMELFQPDRAFGSDDKLLASQDIYRKTLDRRLGADIESFFHSVLITDVARVNAAYNWVKWLCSDVACMDESQIEWLDEFSAFLLSILARMASSDLNVLRLIDAFLRLLVERGRQEAMKKTREVTVNWSPPSIPGEAIEIWQRIRAF